MEPHGRGRLPQIRPQAIGEGLSEIERPGGDGGQRSAMGLAWENTSVTRNAVYLTNTKTNQHGPF